jgi:hypothetical protein
MNHFRHRYSGQYKKFAITIGDMIQNPAEFGLHLSGPRRGAVQHIGKRRQKHRYDTHPGTGFPEIYPGYNSATERNGGQNIGRQTKLQADFAQPDRRFLVKFPFYLIDFHNLPSKQ